MSLDGIVRAQMDAGYPFGIVQMLGFGIFMAAALGYTRTHCNPSFGADLRVTRTSRWHWPESPPPTLLSDEAFG
jgi:hypothetical protein